ncbi:hypothetical protein [Sedimentibacter sp.]|uniref:hypothetical protein n=1 Tax=Sedimentibacter sp. TaxID=1960295 RepID=UPI0028A077C4|nr:hypothetical protein [Sedimentibacter sp.]
MKKRILIVSIVLVCLVLLTIFIINRDPPINNYISITSSKENIDTGKITTKIMVYDIKTKSTEEVFQFEYSAQYPLGYYDAKSKSVYYTKRISIGENIGDNIFVFDLKTSQERQLTKDLFAVNYIISDGDKIFFVGRPNGSQVLKLGVIDLKTNSISYWGDEDTNVEAITIDRKQKKIIASTYSERERVYNVTHQDGPIGQDNMKMPTHTVYEIDYSFENTNKLFEEALWIRAVMVHDSDVYALCDQKYNNSAEPSTLYRYNRNEKIIYTSEWNTHRLQVGDAGFSSDGHHIFSISSVDKQRGIYDFDLITGEVYPIMIQTTGFINNIQVVNFK